MTHRRLAGVFALCAAMSLEAFALAGQREGVTMPDNITVAGEPLVLNGMGVREATMLNVNVYVAGLYLEQKSTNAAEIIQKNDTKRLVLRFVRDVDKDDIVKAWREGFSRNTDKTTLEAMKPRIEQLNGYMRKMKDGDTLVFTHQPGKGVGLAINGAYAGTIPGDDFAKALYSIWLGPKPPNEGLKKGLLGKHD